MPRVLQGPFEGMVYLRNSAGSQLLPKIAGTYELELRNAINQCVASNADLVVDIGSAEGYYLVGLALRLPSAKCIGFEIDETANIFCRRLCEINGVSDRVALNNLCTPEGLQNVLKTAINPLVVCDVEGAEDQVLIPERTPALARATILVELHDGQNEGVGTRLRARFGPSHQIQTIHQTGRTRAMLPTGLNVNDRDADTIMDEGRREPQQWLFMRPVPTVASR